MKKLFKKTNSAIIIVNKTFFKPNKHFIRNMIIYFQDFSGFFYKKARNSTKKLSKKLIQQ